MMDTEAMVNEMYDETLNATELRSIGKSRGFAKSELSSTTLFETVFLTERGLGSAFRSLDRKEIALLHILKLIDKDVDVSFFEPVYADIEKIGKWSYYDSFSKRYRDVLKSVRRSLVRKGVMIFTEKDEYWNNETKIERLIFKFPREFHDLLPSPFPSMKRIEGKVAGTNTVARKKIKYDLKLGKGSIPGGSENYVIAIKNGRLTIGGRPFQYEWIRKWQLGSWKDKVKFDVMKDNVIGSSIKVLQYAFSTLGKNEWIEADDLSVFWDILSPGKEGPDNKMICEEGVKWGYLTKCKFKKNAYYRPAEIMEEEGSDPDKFILKGKDGSLNIDLDMIPFSELEVLASISRMEVQDAKLTFYPDLIRIGNNYRRIRDDPLTAWLENNSKPFRRTLKEVDDRWGKCTIHEDIVMARVTDLSLRVKLQNTFKGKKGIHPLHGDFIAFPVALLPDIYRSVERAGFVIRVNGSDEDGIGGGGRSGT